MIKIQTITLFIIVLISCNGNQKVNKETIDNLQVYIDAKDLLFKNMNQINKVIDEENLRRSWNLHYFESKILKKNQQLDDLKKLWEKEYISSNKVEGRIILLKDSLIRFNTFHEPGIFSSNSHYLVYPPKEYFYSKPSNEEVLLEEKIGDNWKYLIIKRYFNF